MRYLPIFLDVRGQRALVLGRGEVGERKAEALRRAGAEVVFADVYTPDLLDGVVLAIGAEATEGELEALSADAKARALPVNVVDRPALCSYITPAVVDRDPLIVAVGSAGEAPVLARLIRSRIEAMLPPALSRLAAMLGGLSGQLREAFPTPGPRRRVIERIVTGRAADLVLAGDEAAGLAEMQREIAAGTATPPGLIYLVLAGPGAADLVTMRAHRLLGEADVIVHDPSVTAEVIDLARRDADRVAAEADEVGQLRRLAAEGKRVIRLGAALDVDALRNALHGITTEVVPGLCYSAAASCGADSASNASRPCRWQ
ncbi:MAG: NAD(P)-dependent oxidoreductase [Acetobacteraceae bacterium]|nr:NAD(P)-dependent oxidoreductase [Acetobacteraceae bacterium]